MKINSVMRDSARIEAGEWVGDIPRMADLRLKVRGSGSQAYTTVLSRLSNAVTLDERDRNGALTPAAAMRVMGQAAAEALLLDWDGLEDEDGKPLPYSKDLARKWLVDPDYRPILDAVVFASQVVENGRAKVQEQLEKN